MGRTDWKSISFVFLLSFGFLACHERKAPELSVRTPNQSQPNPEETTDNDKVDSADQDKNSPPLSSPTAPSSSPDASRMSVITIGDLAGINVPWAVALVSIQDAKSGSIKYAETISNPAPPQRFQVPYGLYIITLDFFADAAKTQRLAQTCPMDLNRVHKVSEDVYNATIKVCVVGKTDPVPAETDVVIRPVIVP